VTPEEEVVPQWKSDLRSEVQTLGYRNWIVIADASFPFHTRQGVRTVLAPAETPAIVDTIINTIDETQHIKPHFYLARELRNVSNTQAPGVVQYRRELKNSLVIGIQRLNNNSVKVSIGSTAIR